MATSVPFEEIGASPNGRGSRKGDLSFHREFKVAWDDAATFVAELLFGGTLGMPKQFPGWPGMRVKEVTQDPYIELPTNNSAFTDVEVDLVTHEFARIKVDYGPLEPPNANDNLPDGTYAEYEQNQSGEFLQLEGSTMRWATDKTPIPKVHDSVRIPITEHSVSWHRVDVPPWDAISELKGRVNASAFRIPATGQWVAPETLLFMSAKCKKTFNLLTADPTWSLAYSFAERRIPAFTNAAGNIYTSSINATAATVIGWNHAYRQSTGTWQRRENSIGQAEYQGGDFTDLFVFGVGFT